MSREIDLIVVLFGVNFLLFYSIFVRWSCACECAAYLNVFFTYITRWLLFFIYILLFCTHRVSFPFFFPFEYLWQYINTYIMLVMCNFRFWWRAKKKTHNSKPNETLYEIHIRQFNDEYLCVEALLTKRGENAELYCIRYRKRKPTISGSNKK